MGYLVIFLFSCQNLFRIGREVLNIVFIKWSFIIASEFCFGIDLKTCHFIFYFINIFITISVLSDFIRVYFIIRD